MSTLTSTLLFTTNLRRRRRPLVGQRILICASRFEVNAFFEAFEDNNRESQFLSTGFLFFFFFALFPLFHRDVLSD